MAKITFTGVSFHGYRFTTGPKRGEGGPMVIAEFSAPWTERNREAGGWEELPETISGGVKLVPSEFAAQHIEFIPGNGMEKHAFSIDASSAEDFACFVPTKEGEDRELRFTVKTPAKEAGRVLDTFGRTCGEASGKLHITYAEDTQTTIEDKQEPLPLKGEAAAEHHEIQKGRKRGVN